MTRDPPDAASPVLALPAADAEILLRDEMRGVRLAVEYSKAELALRDWGVRSTVVVFGSSRILAPDVAAARLAAAARAGGPALDAARRAERLSAWYGEARAFARIVSERGGALAAGTLRENVIATGGGPGIMEAANRGAADAGAPSIGFNIALPTEQRPNPYSTPELTIGFHYFAVRKMHFAMRANALAFFPGGFGTLDELFEVLTLKQTRKVPALPIVLFCRDYWAKAVNFPELARLGLVEESDLALFEIVDSAEEGWQAMVRGGLPVATPLRER
ncbi:MAG: LOG family protein [Pseudomonadota bacterium]